MTTSFDVQAFIPAAPKDYGKLPYVLDGIERNLPEISAAHIVTPTYVEPSNHRRFPIQYHRDDEVLSFDWSRVQFRPTWCKQQFLKLFQSVTETDWYLVIDADRIINRPLILFDGIRPSLFLSSRDQNADWYFEYNKAMLGIGRVYPHSFLSECTLYSRMLVNDMLTCAGLTVEEWLEKSAQIISATCTPGDAEIYGNFVMNRWPDTYAVKILNDEMRGKYSEQGGWTQIELAVYVAEMRERLDVDFFTAHSWWDG